MTGDHWLTQRVYQQFLGCALIQTPPTVLTQALMLPEASQMVLNGAPIPLISPYPMLVVSLSLQVQLDPDSQVLITSLMAFSMSLVMPSPLDPGVMRTQSGPVAGARNLMKRQDQLGLTLLMPASEPTTFSLVTQTSQLNLTLSVWMTTKKLRLGAPNCSSICSLMYLALASTSSLQKALAELAQLVKAVMCSFLTPAPEKLLNWRAWREVESLTIEGCSIVTARTVAARANRHSAVLISNMICRLTTRYSDQQGYVIGGKERKNGNRDFILFAEGWLRK